MASKDFIVRSNVGVGTSTVTSGTKLQLSGGNVNIASSGYGVVYPDGTFQTTASADRAWVVKTSTYTAANNDKIIIDTTNGSFTVNLPASPSAGWSVQMMDGGNWLVNTPLVSPNGSTIEGNSDNMALNMRGVSIVFVYDGTTWQITVTALSYGMVVGGSNTQVQFNNNGSLGGDSGFVYNSGKVGIGTASPDAALTVNTAASFGDGAAATPSIAHKGDLNTGLWFPAADTIAASTSGSERLRIDSNGNVGIGSSAPVGRLDLAGGTIAGVGNIFGHVASGAYTISSNPYASFDAGAYIQLYGSTNALPSTILLGTASSERMRITDAGRVGIGVTAPNTQLHIGTVDQSTNRIRLQNLGTGGGTFDIVGGNPSVSNAGFAIYDSTNSATRFYITSTGSIGIGTSSPQSLLHVDSSATYSAISTGGSATVGGINLRNSSYANGYIYYDTSASMLFYTNGNERMRINGSGYVGITMTSPPASLSIGAGLLAPLTSVSQYGAFIYAASTGTIYLDALNVAPYGSNLAFRTFDGTSIYTTTITQTGQAYQGNDSSTWSQVSDINIKTNIRSISSALDKITALKPCHFEYKDKIGKIKTGFIAQELEAVLPGHVAEQDPPEQYKQYVEEGAKLKTIDADLIPYLVAAIKELKQEFDDYKAAHP